MPIATGSPGEAARWTEKYCHLLDRTLHNALPDLTDRVADCLSQLSLRDFAFGPDRSFAEQAVRPAVAAWVERHVTPVLRDARQEFLEAFGAEPSHAQGAAGPGVDAGGELYAGDLLKPLALPAGILVGSGALSAAIATTTTWFFFTTLTVNWPLLVGGLVVGGLLSWFGVYSLADLRRDLKDRFKRQLVGQLREGLVGGGAVHHGQRTPSLLGQLQQHIRGAADDLRRRAEGGQA